jgi:hypothetical protein
MRSLLPLLGLLVACADAAPVGDVPRAGLYFVPPRSAASTYAVDDVTFRVEAGEARLDYTLPALLVGSATRVSFRGPAGAGTTTLTGAMGTATCTTGATAGVALRCDERFTGLAVDLAGVRREAMRVDPAAVEARVAVSQRFSIEPIGVLEVPSP